MLVLSRKISEKIIMPLTAKTLWELVALIPKDADPDDLTPIAQIVVIVAEIRHDKTRIGIEAPSVIPCHREEVWDQIRMGKAKKNGQANGSTPDLDMGTEWISDLTGEVTRIPPGASVADVIGR